jgi:hypothetical protein
MIYYTALFLDEESKKVLRENFIPKHANVFFHHVTLQYKPADLSGIQEGRKVKVRIVGRAYDDKGDALVIEGDFNSEIYIPHLTISCSHVMESSYSNELLKNGKIHKLEIPLEIEMTEGWCEVIYNEQGEQRIVHTNG